MEKLSCNVIKLATFLKDIPPSDCVSPSIGGGRAGSRGGGRAGSRGGVALKNKLIDISNYNDSKKNKKT